MKTQCYTLSFALSLMLGALSASAIQATNPGAKPGAVATASGSGRPGQNNLTPAAPVRRLLLVGGLVASLAITGWHHLGGFSRSRAKQDQQHLRAAAALYRTLHWSDDLEVLAENIMGYELAVPASFDGVYVWNLGPRDAVWLVSRRWADANPALLEKVAPGAAWRQHPIYGAFRLVWRKESTRTLACVGPAYIVDAAGHRLPPAPRP